MLCSKEVLATVKPTERVFLAIVRWKGELVVVRNSNALLMITGNLVMWGIRGWLVGN